MKSKFAPVSQESLEDCVDELKVFCQGGYSGKSRLQLVLGSIFKYYEITDFNQQRQILSAVGLNPFIRVFPDGKRKPRVTFWVKTD